jgi:hypothetical protein
MGVRLKTLISSLLRRLLRAIDQGRQQGKVQLQSMAISNTLTKAESLLLALSVHYAEIGLSQAHRIAPSH